NAAVTAAQASIINAADAASLSTAAQRLAAINAAVASFALAGVTNLSAATAGEQTAAATAAAAALNAGEPASVATGIVAALLAVNDAASVAAFPVTAVANTVGGTAIAPVSYTNGDSALWVDATGAAFGRIFQTTT